MFHLKTNFNKFCWFCHRTACWVIAFFVIFLIIVYLLVTSSGFITKALLPIISHFASVQINAEKFLISPFKSRVEIREFRIGRAEKPLLTVREFKGSWRLWQNIAGNLNAEDVEATGVSVWLHRSAPYFISGAPETPPKPAKLPNVRFNLRNITLRDGNISLKRDDDFVTLKVDALHLPQLKHDQPAMLSTNGEIEMFFGKKLNLKGKAQLKCGFTVNRHLYPSQADLNLKTEDISGIAEGFPLKNDTLDLHVKAERQAEQTRLNIFELHHHKNGSFRSSIKADGVFEGSTDSARLNFSIAPLSSEIIRPIVSSFAGFDPGLPELTFDGKLEYEGKQAKGSGKLNLKNRGTTVIAGEKLKFPEWDLSSEYDFSADFARKELRLNKFSFGAHEKKHSVLSLILGAEPLYFSWRIPGKPIIHGSTASWNLKIDHLNPTSFNPLLEPYQIYFDDGAIDLEIAAKVSQKRSGFDFGAKLGIDQLFLRLDEFDLELKKTDYTATIDGTIDPLGRMFTIDKTELWQRDATGALGHALLSGKWDLKTFILDAHVKVDDLSSRAVAPQPMIPDFVRDIINNVLGKYHSADFKFEAHAILDLWNGFLRVPTARLRFQQPPDLNTQRLTVKDFYINWDKDTIMGPCNTVLDLTNFQVNQVNSWVAPEHSFCRNGLLSGRLKFFMDGIATDMVAEAELEILELETNSGKINFPKINIIPQFKISLKDYDIVELEKLELKILRGQHDLAQLRLTATSGSISDMAKAPGISAALQINQLSLPELNFLYPPQNFMFIQGTADAEINGTFKEFGRQMSVSGSLQSKNSQFRLNGKSADFGETKSSFDAVMDDFHRLTIKKIHITSNNAVDAGLSGNIELPFDNAKLNCQLNDLRCNVLELFYPQFRKFDGAFSGDIIASTEKYPQRLDINSKLKITNFKFFGIADGVNGECNINFKQTPDAITTNGVLDASSLGGFNWDSVITGNNPALINISSDKFDLETFHNLIKTKQPAIKTPLPPLPELTFDFSTNPFIVNLKMDSITYSELNKLNLTAEIVGAKNRIDFEPVNININNTPIGLKADATSDTEGIRWHVSSKFRELDLSPLTTTAFEGNYKNISGILESARFNISGNGIRLPRFWDNLEGSWLANYRNVIIPNEFRETVLGRIFFLPFQVVNEIRSATFGKMSSSHKPRNIFSRVIRTHENVEFSDGTINVSAKNGRINLDEVVFNGDLIKELKFGGYLGFGSDQHMLVNSRINIEETILPVTIRGTVYDPEPDYAKAIVQFAAINTGSLIKGVTDIFSSDFFQDIIESITGKNSRRNIYSELKPKEIKDARN